MEKNSQFSRDIIERAAKRMREGRSCGPKGLPRELQLAINWEELSVEKIREGLMKASMKARGV